MRSGFSLIELVVVLAIIVVLGAIAIPRFSRGVEGAGENALSRDLYTLHRAVEMYAAEHGGAFPDAAQVAAQLTQYSCGQGQTSATPTPTRPFGPYIRTIPPVPVGPHRGSRTVAAAAGPNVGWIYDEEEGRFEANLTP